VKLPPPPGHHGLLPLGYSLIDTRARTGALATVHVDRVAGLAMTCDIDLGTVLGREVFTTPAGITSSSADIGVPKVPPFAFGDTFCEWLYTGSAIGALGEDELPTQPAVPTESTTSSVRAGTRNSDTTG
jgi:hypothetical protein